MQNILYITIAIDQLLDIHTTFIFSVFFTNRLFFMLYQPIYSTKPAYHQARSDLLPRTLQVSSS